MTGNNGNSNEPKRKSFKKGEKEKHLGLLAKNYLALEDAKERVKALTEKVKLTAEDIREGGYADPDQGQLPIGDEEQDEARA